MFGREKKPSKYELMLTELEVRVRDYLAGLDRSSIGRLATTDEDALFRASMILSLNSHPYDSKSDFDLSDMSYRYKVPTIPNEVAAEVCFWYGSNINMQHHNLREHYERLVTAAESDTRYLDYFEHGVWNIPFIKRCITGGVDGELAATLYETERQERLLAKDKRIIELVDQGMKLSKKETRYLADRLSELHDLMLGD